MTEPDCPVPNSQRPLNEFNVISNSFILSWPLKDGFKFYILLFYSWITILPLSILICSGSTQLNSNILLLFAVSSITSLSLPVIILMRQWLSWSYLFNRLKSKTVEYEESGWYDGQIWVKPNELRTKEYLIAIHDVKPVIKTIERAILYTLIIIASFTFSYYSFN